MARRIAQVAKVFEQERTGHAPASVTVVLSDEALVILLHGALSEGEMTLSKDPDGAAKVQEFHRQLFDNTAATLRVEIERITGVKVHDSAVELEPKSGAVVRTFANGTVVQVFLLSDKVAADVWSNDRSSEDEPLGT